MDRIDEKSFNKGGGFSYDHILPRTFIFASYVEYEKDAEQNSENPDREISGIWQKFLPFSPKFFDLTLSVPRRGKW